MKTGAKRSQPGVGAARQAKPVELEHNTVRKFLKRITALFAFIPATLGL